MLVHPQFDPVAVQLGPVAFHWYGLMYLVAFGLFLWLASRRVAQPQFAAAGWTRAPILRKLSSLPSAGPTRTRQERSRRLTTWPTTGAPD